MKLLARRDGTAEGTEPGWYEAGRQRRSLLGAEGSRLTAPSLAEADIMGLSVLRASVTWPPHGNVQEVSSTEFTAEPHPVPVLAVHHVGVSTGLRILKTWSPSQGSKAVF